MCQQCARIMCAHPGTKHGVAWTKALDTSDMGPSRMWKCVGNYMSLEQMPLSGQVYIRREVVDCQGPKTRQVRALKDISHKLHRCLSGLVELGVGSTEVPKPSEMG